MRTSSITRRDVFCKGFVDIRYENVLFLILEEPIWLQLIYFLTAIGFWYVKCLFKIDGDTLNQPPQGGKEFIVVVIIII